MITEIFRVPVDQATRSLNSHAVHITGGPLKGKTAEYVRMKKDHQTGEIYYIVALNRERSEESVYSKVEGKHE